jgi:hypothetical protein
MPGVHKSNTPDRYAPGDFDDMPIRRNYMQYLLIISHDDFFAPNEALFQGIGAWIKEMERRGIRVYGNPLRPAGDATTVRVRKGNVVLKKGPFANSKEKMCAYELIECSSEQEAIELASLHPMATAATIEVRPIWNELAGQ